MPYVIFGVLALIGGVFSLFLPESTNQVLPETVEDGEAFGTYVMSYVIVSVCKSVVCQKKISSECCTQSGYTYRVTSVVASNPVYF